MTHPNQRTAGQGFDTDSTSFMGREQLLSTIPTATDADDREAAARYLSRQPDGEHLAVMLGLD